jgi:nicotinamidase-related amidase
MAEVPDPSDPGTALNTGFLTTLADADIIGVCGQASTHCVWNTVEQVGENIGAQHLKKFHLLLDGMSPVVVPGVVFPDIRDMKQKYGMTLSTTTDFLS